MTIRRAPKPAHVDMERADEPRVDAPGTACDAAVGAVWLRIETAAALVDLTPAALRKRIVRAKVPAGIVTHFGWSIRIHKDLFLAWVASGGASGDHARIGA